MRKIFYSSLIIGISMFVVSCGGQEEMKSETSDIMSAETTSDQTDEIIAERQESGMELMDTETIGKLYLGLTTDEVVALLGKPESSEAIFISEIDGENYQYQLYPSKGIRLLFLLPKSGKNELSEIEVKAPSVLKTSRNIGIGSSYKETKTAYENVLDLDFTNEKQVVAGSIYGGVVFNFENQKVARMFIGASAE